ncbi:hypothetical protein AKJ16_DCAP16338 [Drosera capensis]
MSYENTLLSIFDSSTIGVRVCPGFSSTSSISLVELAVGGKQVGTDPLTGKSESKTDPTASATSACFKDSSVATVRSSISLRLASSFLAASIWLAIRAST